MKLRLLQSLACYPSRPRGSWLSSITDRSDLDEIRIVGRRPTWRRPIFRQRIGAARGVGAVVGWREPRPFLDRHHASGDTRRDLDRQQGRTAIVEDAHFLSVSDAA